MPAAHTTINPPQPTTKRIPPATTSDPPLPPSLQTLDNPQTDISRIAKDPKLTAEIESIVQTLHTTHTLRRDDARNLTTLDPASVHLVLTSPPYWTLKKYREHHAQLGHLQDYENFLDQLDTIWRACFNALVPGGRLICVVGDVCLSRRSNNGRHTVVPLHAAIQQRCVNLGFDNLAPIIWHKIANASYEVENGSSFLGKPYEPNAVIKNDIEFILMLRKPGGYRNPSVNTRVLSVIPAKKHQQWFQQIWTGLTGASTRQHPAPFPLELADRLTRMFSFVGDTVLDPFMGTATTNVAAAKAGRNSIGCEVDPHYFQIAHDRLRKHTATLFGGCDIHTTKPPQPDE